VKLQPWELAIVMSVAMSLLTLMMARRIIERRNDRLLKRLTSECRILERWWRVVEDLPMTALSLPLRTTIGSIIAQRLASAGSLHAGHPSMAAQQVQIERFCGQPAGARARRQSLAELRDGQTALTRLRELLRETADDGLLSSEALRQCEAEITDLTRALLPIETRHADARAAYLRSLTEAIQGTQEPAVFGRAWADQRRRSNDPLPSRS
jgi:hypothetical protein